MLMRMLWPRAITPWWVTHVGACHGPSDSHFLFTWYVAQSGLKLWWSYIEVQLLNRSQLWAQYTQPAGIKLNPWRGWMEPIPLWWRCSEVFDILWKLQPVIPIWNARHEMFWHSSPLLDSQLSVAFFQNKEQGMWFLIIQRWHSLCLCCTFSDFKQIGKHTKNCKTNLYFFQSIAISWERKELSEIRWCEKQTSQELRMLSSVTINCQITNIVMNSCSQLSEL